MNCFFDFHFFVYYNNNKCRWRDVMILSVIIGIITFLAFIAYFFYVLMRFFTSKIALIQLPLYLFGFLWGVFSGNFFYSVEGLPSLIDLLYGDPKNFWGPELKNNYFMAFLLSVFLCHIHGVIITPIAIIATIEFALTFIFFRRIT